MLDDFVQFEEQIHAALDVVVLASMRFIMRTVSETARSPPSST
jgi:hypothetical protein